jgi:hypothetical protein
MKIGEQFTFLQLPFHGDPYPADSRPVCNSITLTPEAGDILSLILEQLADFPNPQRGALLLSGDIGVDKSHLLHFLECMLANPEYPLWNDLLQCLNLSEEVRPKAPLRSLFVHIPPDPEKDLAAFLIERLQLAVTKILRISPAQEIVAAEFSANMQQIAICMAEQSTGVIVLENATERIEQLQDERKLQAELRLYRILCELFSQNGILTIFPGKGKSLSPEDRASALLTGAEDVDRRYSWIEFANPSSFALPQRAAAPEEEFQKRLQLLIYDWIQAEIPSWQPEHSPRYQHDSQALTAAIPESEKAPAGLVYFKSVFDPYWSDEDLVRLESAGYPWILMILNPAERFYEFETRLQEIASRLQMLIIWRPDAPSKAEFESMHRMATPAAEAADGEDFIEEAVFQQVRPLLADLYINRGRLISASSEHYISDEIKKLKLGQYISTCLIRLLQHRAGADVQGAVLQAETVRNSQAMHWAAVIAGHEKLDESKVLQAQEQVMAWWSASVEDLAKKSPDFPEAFRTTRFRSDIKYIENPLQALKPIFQSLQSGAFSLFEAMDHVGRNFAWDENRLLQWKKGLESLKKFTLWLPTFVHAEEYLKAAFPVNREDVDKCRESLLQSLNEPSRFLEAGVQGEFDEKFLEFKKNYTDAYYFLHEDALHIMSGLQKDEVKIDPVLLRNLDLLSGLKYADKGYLNRVKLLARWIQHNQCNLPVRQILERYPRCYCNFNPSGDQKSAGSISQINSSIQEGIDYFRRILRKCGYLIAEGLKEQEVSEAILRQITAALGDGPMIPMSPKSIRTLNAIISKAPNEFLSEIRKAGKPAHKAH